MEATEASSRAVTPIVLPPGVEGGSGWGRGPAREVRREPAPWDPELPVRYARPRQYICSVARPNPLHLKVESVAQFSDGRRIRLDILVDTGAQVNILKTGLAPEGLCRPSSKPIVFLQADSSKPRGGASEVDCQVFMRGTEIDTGRETYAALPVTWYEGDIMADAIVSLAWLAEFDVDINSQNHLVIIKSTPRPVRVAGLLEPPRRGLALGSEVLTVQGTPSPLTASKAVDLRMGGKKQLEKPLAKGSQAMGSPD